MRTRFVSTPAAFGKAWGPAAVLLAVAAGTAWGKLGAGQRVLIVGPLQDCESAAGYRELLACDEANGAAFRGARVEVLESAPEGWLEHPEGGPEGWHLNPGRLGQYARILKRGDGVQHDGTSWLPRIFAPISVEVEALRAALYFRGLKRMVSGQAERQIPAPDRKSLRGLLERNKTFLKSRSVPDDAADVAGMFEFLNGDLELGAPPPGGEGEGAAPGAPSAPPVPAEKPPWKPPWKSWSRDSALRAARAAKRPLGMLLLGVGAALLGLQAALGGASPWGWDLPSPRPRSPSR